MPDNNAGREASLCGRGCSRGQAGGSDRRWKLLGVIAVIAAAMIAQVFLARKAGTPRDQQAGTIVPTNEFASSAGLSGCGCIGGPR